LQQLLSQGRHRALRLDKSPAGRIDLLAGTARQHVAAQRGINATHVLTNEPDMSIAKSKTAILSIRIAPSVRAALERAAEAERRSLANMAEVMLLEGCARRGIPEPSTATTPSSKKKLS
jgi:hypothetical protein